MRFMIWGLAIVAGMAASAYGYFLYRSGNVEQAPYAVVTSDGAFEVREYPELVVAEVRRSGNRQDAVSAGFGPLARYIFARDRSGDQVSMTAPVTQQRETIAMTAPVTQTPETGGMWRVRFVMPAGYTLDTLPSSANPDVTLKTLAPTRSAAVRFSGVANDDLIAAEEAKLRAWMAKAGLEPAGPPTYAYYNDPFTPGFLRRNEVLIEVRSP